MNNTVMDKNTLMDKMDELKELMGADTLLEELARALSVDDLRDNLEYIDRMHDTNVFQRKWFFGWVRFPPCA